MIFIYPNRDEDAPEKIVDPNAKKPAGWLDDAPETVPDPSAVKPADWDDEEDGEWEPPQIPNPKCAEVGCGEWKAPMIANPKYKGKWSAPLIKNPAYKVTQCSLPGNFAVKPHEILSSHLDGQVWSWYGQC